MERGSMEKLKFDKRLARRRDWVDQSELSSHVDALPDVADKCWKEEQEAEGSTPEANPEATPEATPAADPGVSPASESTPSPGSEF
jgi:hypothetical protein